MSMGRIIDYYHIPDLNIVNKSLINTNHHIDEEHVNQTLKAFGRKRKVTYSAPL